MLISVSELDAKRKFLFDEARAGLNRDAARLHGLHARASVLLTAASVSAGLLGAAAFKDGANWGWSTVAGTAMFGVVVAAAVFILVPRSYWVFVLPDSELRVPYEEGDAMLTRLTDFALDNSKANDRHLDVLSHAAGIAALAVGLEVIFFFLDLARR
jgi:hypothetical protein